MAAPEGISDEDRLNSIRVHQGQVWDDDVNFLLNYIDKAVAEAKKNAIRDYRERTEGQW